MGIIRLSSIGDVVLATACLDYLKRSASSAEVVWVGRGPSLDLIKEAWPSVEVAHMTRGKGGGSSGDAFLALSKCDVVIDLQTSLRTWMIARRLRRQGVPVFEAGKYRVKRFLLVLEGWLRGRLYRMPESSRSLFQFQYKMMLSAMHEGMARVKHASDEALISARPLLPVGHVSGEQQSWARDMEFGSWLAVAPGASFATKRAPTEVFIDVLAGLAGQMSGNSAMPGLVFVGGPEDRAAAIELLDKTRWEGPVLNLAGKLSLEQTRAVMTRASCLLSNDSGLAHIAEASGKPVAVLFGPTTEAFGFPPHRPESRAFSSPIGCRPCSKHGKRGCRYGDQLCFRSINTRDVARFLHDKLRLEAR